VHNFEQVSKYGSQVTIESDGAIAVSAATPDDVEIGAGFSVHLNNFDGPFDLLLQLISRHKMDIAEVSLSMVTDEFIAFIRALEASGEGWRLDQATEFLVILQLCSILRRLDCCRAVRLKMRKIWRYLRRGIFSLPACSSTEPSRRLRQTLPFRSKLPINPSLA